MELTRFYMTNSKNRGGDRGEEAVLELCVRFRGRDRGTFGT